MNPKQVYGDKKPPLGLVPLSALIHATMAFYDGAGKYGKANWRENPVEAQTYVEAILRHVLLWANGEENARDTGVHNLGGVIASAGLLIDAQANGVLIDNRIKSQANCDLLHEAEALLEKLKAQHAARRAAQDVEAGKQPTYRVRLTEDIDYGGFGRVELHKGDEFEATIKDDCLLIYKGGNPYYIGFDKALRVWDLAPSEPAPVDIIRNEVSGDWQEPDLGVVRTSERIWTQDPPYPRDAIDAG